MDPQLEEQLNRLGELTDDELQELLDNLTAEFDRLDEANDVDGMDEVANAIDTVKSTRSQRESEAAEREQRAAELRNRIHGQEGEDGGEGDGAGEQVEEDDEDEKGPQAVAASSRRTPPARPGVGAMNAHRDPSRAPRRELSAASRATGGVKLMSNAGDKRIGDPLESFDALAEAMTERIRSLGRGSGEMLLVARAEVEYPEDRQLGGDIWENSRKVNEVLRPEAITASGGICAPVEVDYSILVVSDDSEPIFDSLPQFNATRGGIRFIEPPTFASVGRAGTAIWTEATDAAPGGATKPVQTIACGAELEVLVDAIPTRLRFGNLMARFSPEIVAANTQLALANAAQVRELYLLNAIAANSVSVSSGQLLGAARDMLTTLDQAAAAYRRRHRIRRDGVKLRLLLPDWFLDMLRADLTREMAHGDDSNLSLTDAEVEALLTDRGYVVTWFMDGQPAITTATGTQLAYVDQTFAAAQAPVTALNDWPREVVWYIFAEGTFQVLDGGTLDIGVVRDSTLDSTNDYETFVEVFRGLARRGYESLQVVSTTRPNGLSAGTANTSTY